MSAIASPDAAPAAEPDDPAERLRGAIARDYERLCRYAWPAVVKATGPRPFHETRERVQEVVAEAIRRALEREDRYDRCRHLLPWLWGFVLMVLRESSRARRRRQPANESDVSPAAWAGALDALIDPAGAPEVERERVRQALAKLRESDRRLLELRFVEGLEINTIAAQTGAPSERAVRVALHRATRALRAALTEGDAAPVIPDGSGAARASNRRGGRRGRVERGGEEHVP